MKLFSCNECGNTLYFDNHQCVVCQNKVGFCSERLDLVTLRPYLKGIYSDVTDDTIRYKNCFNAEYGVCNWLIHEEDSSPFCKACQLNRVIPNLSVPENLRKWTELELAKHRLVYALLRLGLPFYDTREGMFSALQFHFLSSEEGEKPVLTSHKGGIVTINIDEADEAFRSKAKSALGERYRTTLGHFRHESGHFYWDLLVRGTPIQPEFRYLFGDERTDYAQALNQYYQYGAPSDWRNQYISEYATSHPWEDWAETWANYLHVMDTLETAWAFGVEVSPVQISNKAFHTHIDQDPYEELDFGKIMSKWLPFTIAANNINRSMGYSDFYTFYISPIVVEKMTFIHKLCSLFRKVNS